MIIYLYKITNCINQKEYIGVHSTTDLNDGYLGSGTAISAAIKKYGTENFSKEILQFFNNKQDAYRAEREIVNEQYVQNQNTYNLTLGGNVPPVREGCSLTTEQKKKLSEYRQTIKGKDDSSRGGKSLWKSKNGWSSDDIAKRVRTRKEKGNYSSDMSACHTAEAIAQRNKTRKEKGVNYNTTNCSSPDAVFKREKTKILNLIKKLCTYYNEKFSEELFIKAKKDRVTYLRKQSLDKFVTIDDLLRLGLI